MKSLLVIVLGLAAIVLGGIDDAPGAQLLGVLLIAGAAVWLFRRIVRKQPPRTQARGTSA